MVIKQTHNNHSINLISGLYAGIFRVVKVQIAVYDYDKTTHYSPADSGVIGGHRDRYIDSIA